MNGNSKITLDFCQILLQYFLSFTLRNMSKAVCYYACIQSLIVTNCHYLSLFVTILHGERSDHHINVTFVSHCDHYVGVTILGPEVCPVMADIFVHLCWLCVFF